MWPKIKMSPICKLSFFRILVSQRTSATTCKAHDFNYYSIKIRHKNSFTPQLLAVISCPILFSIYFVNYLRSKCRHVTQNPKTYESPPVIVQVHWFSFQQSCIACCSQIYWRLPPKRKSILAHDSICLFTYPHRLASHNIIHDANLMNGSILRVTVAFCSLTLRNLLYLKKINEDILTALQVWYKEATICEESQS